MTKHILLVDADDLLRRSLADQLTGKGFAVSQVSSGAEALAAAASGTVDVVVVDAGLVDGTAVELCQSLRGGSSPAPIIVLGAGPSEIPALQAAGAGHCLAKPFRFAALLERLEGLLREPTCEVVMKIGAMRFHPLTRLIVDDAGRQIRLTEKEVAILAYLHHAGDRPVPREELLGEVWGYASAASTHTVETHIYRLRRKLDCGNDDSSPLRTEAGGYRLAMVVPSGGSPFRA